MLDGTDVILVWLPSDDPGGDPSNLYYDVYAAQLGGDNPTFRRQNDGPIDKSKYNMYVIIQHLVFCSVASKMNGWYVWLCCCVCSV